MDNHSCSWRRSRHRLPDDAGEIRTTGQVQLHPAGLDIRVDVRIPHTIGLCPLYLRRIDNSRKVNEIKRQIRVLRSPPTPGALRKVRRLVK